MDAAEEVFSSTSSDNTNSSSLGSSVNQLLTEEDLIKSFFYACDVRNTGFAPVSELLDYLQSTTTNITEHEVETIQELQGVLDPDGTDPSVDLQTYKHAIAVWKEKVRLQEFSSYDDDDDVFTNSPVHLRNARLSQFSTQQNGHFAMGSQGTVSSMVSTHYSNCVSSSGASDQQVCDNDRSELVGHVSDLTFQNQRLSEENATLRRQQESSEEAFSCLSQRNEDLQNQNKSLNASHQQLQECRQEGDLQNEHIHALETSKADLERQVHEHEKDVSILTSNNMRLQQQVDRLFNEVEQTNRERVELEKQLRELKHSHHMAEKVSLMHETDLAETTCQVAELKHALSEMEKINQSEKLKKTELEEQLCDTQQQLALARIDAEHVNEVETLDEDEDEEDLMPVKLVPVGSYMTPHKASSICSEIKPTIMMDPPTMNSPLCEKEVEKFVFPDVCASHSVQPEAMQDLHLYMSSSRTSAVTRRRSIDSSLERTVQMDEEIRKSKEKILRLVQQMKPRCMASIPSLDLSGQESPDHASQSGAADPSPKFATRQQQRQTRSLLQTLQREIHDFTDRISTWLAVKHAADNKISVLSNALQKVVDENQQHLEAEKHNANRLKEQIQQKDVQLHESGLLQHKLQDTISILNVEVLKLESINDDFEERCEKAEAQMTDYKHELQKKNAEDEAKIIALEERLPYDQYTADQLVMSDLWRLVHHTDTDCYTDTPHDTPITVSADSVRDQVAKEIESLRSQLARSEATLAKLQNRTLPVQHTAGGGAQDLRNNNKHRPDSSSPLVEALNLVDFCCEGNRNGSNSGAGGRGVPGVVSADNLLERREQDPRLDGAPLPQRLTRSPRLDSASCPHLAQRLVTCSTQTEAQLRRAGSGGGGGRRRAPQIGANVYTAVNTSTGSSTSGVDVSSTSSRSDVPLYPQHAQHPHHPRKSVLIIETACTPESPSSPDDPDNPLCRYRTSSFKRAIERGQSGDSSNLSFDTCELISTSPDLSPERSLPPFPDRLPAPPPRDTSKSLSLSLSPLHPGAAPPPPQYHGKHRLQPPAPHYLDSTGHDYGGGTDPLLLGDLPDPQQDAQHNGGAQDPQGLLDGAESPARSRRLSTLVEESDAEAEETGGRGLPRSPRTPRSPRFPGDTPSPGMLRPAVPRHPGPDPRRPGPDPRHPGLDPRHPGPDPRHLGQDPPAAPGAGGDPRPRTPPQYKEPPTYYTAVAGPSPTSAPLSRPGSSCSQRSRSLSPGSAAGRGAVPPGVDRSPSPARTLHPQQQQQHAPHLTAASQSLPGSPSARFMSSSQRSRAVFRGDTSEDPLSPDPASARGSPPAPLTPRLTSAPVTPGPTSADSDPPDKSSPREAEKLSQVGRVRRRSLQELKQSGVQDDSVEEDVITPLHPATEAVCGPAGDAAVLLDDDVFDKTCTSPSATRPTTRPSSRTMVEQDEVAEQDAAGGGGGTAGTSPPPKVTTSVQLNKIREEHLAKKRGLTKQLSKSMMPELSEDAVADFQTEEPAPREVSSTSSRGQVTNGSLAQDAVYPSLSDEVLSRLGLQRDLGSPLDSTQDLPEQDIEDKYTNLALAFKTDALTLDKRIELHRRARDIAEENIDREMQGLKDAMKALGPCCTDSQSLNVYSKINHHVDVLEQSSARMSSRAEVHGAVQQEYRISQAINVMLQHVDNLKRLHEKDRCELEETRRMLQDNKLMLPGQAGDGDMRRGISMMGSLGAKSLLNQWNRRGVGGRRRASVAVLPRALPAAAHLSTSHARTTDDMKSKRKPPSILKPKQDPKGRLQSLLVGTSKVIRRASLAITNTSPFHRASLALSTASEPSPPPHSNDLTPLFPRSISAPENRHRKPVLIIEEEESDTQDKLDEDDESSPVTLTMPNLELLQQLAQAQSEFIEEEENLVLPPRVADRLLALWPGWEKFLWRLRYTVAGVVFLLAVLSLVFTWVPTGAASPRHPRTWTWSSPHLDLRHFESPPV